MHNRTLAAATAASILALAACAKQERTTAEADARAPQTPAGMPARGTRSPDPSAVTAGTADPQLAKQWASLQERVPQMLSTIQSRMSILSQSSKLPKGMDKATFEQAQASAETMRSSWAEATQDYSAGNVQGAIEKGQIAAAAGEKVLAQLGMPTGTG